MNTEKKKIIFSAFILASAGQESEIFCKFNKYPTRQVTGFWADFHINSHNLQNRKSFHLFEFVGCRTYHVYGVNVEVDADVVVVPHHDHVHPEGHPLDASGPAGLLPLDHPARPVGVAPEAVVEEVELRLSSHHQEVGLDRRER